MTASSDTSPSEDPSAGGARSVASRAIRSGERTWFNVVGMLQQNWAVCEPGPHNCLVRFFDDNGDVFDRLEFRNEEEAANSLWFNQFTRIRERPSFLTYASLPRSALRDSGRNSMPVYSSGTHWNVPPAGYKHRLRLHLGDDSDSSLERFINAQDPVWFNVLEELMAGQKQTHWMWFVFPQHRSLGRSANAEYYGIASLGEAERYWEDQILGPRLKLACSLLMEVDDKSAEEILGPVDALKLRSCATLFGLAAARERVFPELITKYFGGQLCSRTVQALEQV